MDSGIRKRTEPGGSITKINGTVILLTYYYNQEDRNLRLLKYVKNYLGVYLPFNLYLYEPLQKIFSKVILYDYLKRRAEIGVKAVNEEIIDMVRKEHPEYVIWTSWQYDIQEATFEEIRKESTVVGWFFDDDWRFDEYSKWWAPYLDYCVTNAIEAVPKYRELNARVIQTVPNTGIAIDRDWSNIEERYDVSFVGSRICADRNHYINILKKNNIPVQLFGDGWGGYVSFEEMIDVFKTSKINLNFSKDVANQEKLQIKGRVFQVCMAGGFMLTEYAPGIEKYFDIDKEIVCFRNAKEMLQKITYYLEHEKERRAIARAGWEKATNEYTSYHMVARVFWEIEQDMVARENYPKPRPQKLKIPMHIRNIRSRYHFQWARALLEENYSKDLWKDALALSLSYNPDSVRLGALYYCAVSFLPPFMRPVSLGVYRVLEKLHGEVLFRLGSIISLRRMKQRFTKKLWDTVRNG